MQISQQIQKKLASDWFRFLQSKIVEEFQNIEKNFSKKKGAKIKYFQKNKWKKKNIKDGGGTYYLLKRGKVFDKVGVNHSTVQGLFPKNFKSKIPGTNTNNSYWASGISVVAHMKNPKVPAIHFNTRFVITSKSWFGGGMDVTPSFFDLKEKKLLNRKLKTLCRNNKKNYNDYKKWCDNYFFIKHKKEIRGIGGIFFDYLYKDWKKNFKFTRELGICFLDFSKTIIKNKMLIKWKKKQKKDQLIKRGKYVEFNLLYDRGTKFGLNTGGNLDAIFMSLPPEAKWK
ncbi:MAG: oxygen-dependent coproporphyrinogen oxidase [Pelagibacteraceae bacterium TMED124]|nr:MAG: oxygen-dependent coproporphyrinogen oxidase [Pelagibacteraceae bacterium TMED124]|tara:strand:+ start:107 stop:958 length:852 start_codon:yes stop_codon:yes gene_type:complete